MQVAGQQLPGGRVFLLAQQFGPHKKSPGRAELSGRGAPNAQWVIRGFER